MQEQKPSLVNEVGAFPHRMNIAFCKEQEQYEHLNSAIPTKDHRCVMSSAVVWTNCISAELQFCAGGVFQCALVAGPFSGARRSSGGGHLSSTS